MIPYGKTAQHAIAAMSRLAEVYPRGVRVCSREIAESRGLPQPIVAKVLTVLSQSGLIVGSPGPGGGYALAHPPQQISLFAVAELFDRQQESLSCPYGPHYCGNGLPCPLHSRIETLRDQIRDFLQTTTFAVFVGREPGVAPTAPPPAEAGGYDWDA